LLGILVPSGDFTPLTPVLPADAALPGLGMRVPEPGGVLQQHRLTITAVLHSGLLHAGGPQLAGISGPVRGLHLTHASLASGRSRIEIDQLSYKPLRQI